MRAQCECWKQSWQPDVRGKHPDWVVMFLENGFQSTAGKVSSSFRQDGDGVVEKTVFSNEKCNNVSLR